MKTSKIGSGMLVALAVAAMGVAACNRSEKVGETSTTSATPSAPAEATPTPAAAPVPDDSLAADSMKDAGHIAPVGAPARRATSTGTQTGGSGPSTGTGRTTGRSSTATPVQPNSVDNSVGPGHITTPALPDDHRATGAPNNDGSHNIGR